MYSVEVHSDLTLPGSITRVTRFIVFECFTSALSCISSLEAREPGKYSPQFYFEEYPLSRVPVGEVVTERSIETDWVISYLNKD